MKIAYILFFLSVHAYIVSSFEFENEAELKKILQDNGWREIQRGNLCDFDPELHDNGRVSIENVLSYRSGDVHFYVSEDTQTSEGVVKQGWHVKHNMPLFNKDRFFLRDDLVACALYGVIRGVLFYEKL